MPISTRENSDAARSCDAGFTLIELNLVLLIIGVLLTLAVPRLGLITEARLDSEAARLGTTLTYLHDEAALRGRIYRVRFDLDRESWTVQVQAPFSEGEIAEGFVAEWDPIAEATQYDRDIDLVSVQQADGSTRAGTADVYFFPESGAGETEVTLGNGRRAVKLTLDGVTGRVEQISIEEPF
jgi:prepilin-type N-terminal cleavage/methylation domain-containing protein